MDRVSGVFFYEVIGAITSNPERLTVKFNEVLRKALAQHNQGREASAEVSALDGVWMPGRGSMGTSFSGQSQEDVLNCARKVSRMLPVPLSASVSMNERSPFRTVKIRGESRADATVDAPLQTI